VRSAWSVWDSGTSASLFGRCAAPGMKVMHWYGWQMRWPGFYEMPKKAKRNGRRASYARKLRESFGRCKTSEKEKPPWLGGSA
jgi:hypothetical protein